MLLSNHVETSHCTLPPTATLLLNDVPIQFSAVRSMSLYPIISPVVLPTINCTGKPPYTLFGYVFVLLSHACTACVSCLHCCWCALLLTPCRSIWREVCSLTTTRGELVGSTSVSYGNLEHSTIACNIRNVVCNTFYPEGFEKA